MNQLEQIDREFEELDQFLREQRIQLNKWRCEQHDRLDDFKKKFDDIKRVEELNTPDPITDNSCTPTLGLYESRYITHYDDCGSNSDERLLAVGSSVQELQDRYNKKIDNELAEVAHLHESYSRYISPKFEGNETKIKWNGSTGGGCASVKYEAVIKRIKQFDDPKEQEQQ